MAGMDQVRYRGEFTKITISRTIFRGVNQLDEVKTGGLTRSRKRGLMCSGVGRGRWHAWVYRPKQSVGLPPTPLPQTTMSLSTTASPHLLRVPWSSQRFAAGRDA
jgi:hypothetical protein